MSETAFILFGSSGEYEDYGAWPVCVCANQKQAEALRRVAELEMEMALLWDMQSRPWPEVASCLSADPEADVVNSARYFVKEVRVASGIEARSDATGTGAAEGKSPPEGDAQNG